MANYLYNGVELPDINSVWTDRKTYPYAVISLIGLSPKKYTLRMFAHPYATSGTSATYSQYIGDYVVTGETFLSCTCPKTDSGDGTFVWSEPTEVVVPEETDGAYGIFVGNPKWCNYDLTTTDGTVWLAACEDPNPLPTAFVYDKKSFLSGFAAGLCGRGVATEESYPLEEGTNKQSYLTGYMMGCRLREGRPSGVMGEPVPQ